MAIVITPLRFLENSKVYPCSVCVPVKIRRKREEGKQKSLPSRIVGISGAGGINPGITLTQEGMLGGGQNVALNGPIKPGDLLTTSEMPGHAMKARDVSRSHGTVIGKAMSRLENGEGLVLVLVNLQ